MIVIALNPNSKLKKDFSINFPSEYFLVGKINKYYIYFSSLECKLVISRATERINRIFAERKPLPPFIYPLVITIFVTTECNLNCNYCYAKGAKTISPWQRFNSVKDFLDLSIKDNPVDRVRFQGGGEPTLDIDLIKKTISYAKNKYNIKKFEIQTNLLFPEKVAKFIAKNFSYVYGSVDGPEEIQFKNRGITSNQNKIIERNLCYLAKKIPHFSVKCTVSRYSNKRMKEIIDYFWKKGVRNIIFEPIFKMGKAEKSENDFNTPPSLSNFLKEFLKIKKYAERKKVFAFSCFLPLEYSGVYYCGGVSCSPCLTTDGYISTCDEHFLGENDKSPFIIGKIEERGKRIIYNRENISSLRKRNVLNLKTCENCFLKWSCRGQCPSRVFAETGDIYKPNKKKCNLVKKYSKDYLLYKAREILRNKNEEKL